MATAASAVATVKIVSAYCGLQHLRLLCAFVKLCGDLE